MVDSTKWWRRAGAVVVAGALALSVGGPLLAQSPSPQPTGRTSTVLSPQPSAPLPTAQPTPSPGPTAAAPSGMVAVVTDPDGLNLRGGPGTEYPSLAVLPQGAEAPILGERVNMNWLPVSYQGQRGFINDGFVSIRSAGTSAQPTAAPAGSPSASVPASPAPTPRPSVPPTLSPERAQFDNGVLVAGVFASDIDDMITIADEFRIVVVARPPAGVTRLTVRLSGAPFLRAQESFDVQPGDNWLEIANFKVDTENEPVLREEIVRKVGGAIPIRDGALAMAIDYTNAAGAMQTASFQPAVYDFNAPTRIAQVEYPDLKRITGLPPGGAGADNYYLRGDLDFHHPEDFYVRKLAVEMGRRGGVFPDNPELVADNVFSYINATFGDAEPGDFNNDYNVARLIEEGTIKRGQLNGGYICIAQTYLMTAITRTLGLPSRELNIAVGRANWLGNDGVWRVTWWQEGAIHTWYNGRWNHYDLWLGFKGMNGYFQANLAYQAWAAFNRQTSAFLVLNSGQSTGLRGHDFNKWPGEPPQWNFVREASKPGSAVLDIPAENGEPLSTLPGLGAFREVDAADLPRGPAIRTAQPPAAIGILNPPETRP